MHTNESLPAVEGGPSVPPAVEPGSVIQAPPAPIPTVKLARVVDEEDDSFALEYENTLGKKNVMRLEAFSYEQAVREAKSFLEISADGRDANGIHWDLE
jgi:hypothetical protein